jgi:pyrimidine-nucleoside phosphorylase
VVQLQSEIIRLIQKKRDGFKHSPEEILWLINHLEQIPDYQLSAWLMAVFINGLDEIETRELTRAMAFSGQVLKFRSHSGNLTKTSAKQVRGFVDKHSTGGVGDKTTLVLMPLLASLGYKVSKFSGRALGHTGGTIDKLEAIPGFRTDIDIDRFEKQIHEIGLAIAAQTQDFAPADKRLYRLRDLSGSVESIPLIAASIMSKKIAGGAENIILDVKVGSGAFMKDLKTAKKLARQMIKIAQGLDLKVTALISNMDQVLGYAVGNGPELLEAIAILKNENHTGINELRELVIEMVASLEPANKNFRKEIISVLDSGKAYEKFSEWIKFQGGDLEGLEEKLRPKYRLDFRAEEEGYLASMDTYKIGLLIHELAYKLNSEGSYDIDNQAGMILRKKQGDKVNNGDILFSLFSKNTKELELKSYEISKTFKLSKSKPPKTKLLLVDPLLQ